MRIRRRFHSPEHRQPVPRASPARPRSFQKYRPSSFREHCTKLARARLGTTPEISELRSHLDDRRASTEYQKRGRAMRLPRARIPPCAASSKARRNAVGRARCHAHFSRPIRFFAHVQEHQRKARMMMKNTTTTADALPRCRKRMPAGTVEIDGSDAVRAARLRRRCVKRFNASMVRITGRTNQKRLRATESDLAKSATRARRASRSRRFGRKRRQSAKHDQHHQASSANSTSTMLGSPASANKPTARRQPTT